MNNVTSIFKNRAPEKPATLIEDILHIVRAQQPKTSKWGHMCHKRGMAHVMLNEGEICPQCFNDQNGAFHGRKD